jgi:hypothetical protein
MLEAAETEGTIGRLSRPAVYENGGQGIRTPRLLQATPAKGPGRPGFASNPDQPPEFHGSINIGVPSFQQEWLPILVGERRGRGVHLPDAPGLGLRLGRGKPGEARGIGPSSRRRHGRLGLTSRFPTDHA